MINIPIYVSTNKLMTGLLIYVNFLKIVKTNFLYMEQKTFLYTKQSMLVL